MSVALLDERKTRQPPRGVMRANVFRSSGRFGLEDKAIPRAGPHDAVVRVRLNTICDSDLHIVRGNHPVTPGLTLGHEAVGVIQELGAEVPGYAPGQRVLVGAITPCGQCESCLGGNTSRCTWQVGAAGGWRLGNTIDGTQAEYVLIPYAQANLAVIPTALSDEQVLLLAHVASTGFACAEQSGIQPGDSVAVFGSSAFGLCAVLGARLRGAAQIIAVDRNSARLTLARQYGASVTVQSGEELNAKIRAMTDSRGVDVACVDAANEPGVEDAFESAWRALRPGGTLSSVGVSCGHGRGRPDARGTVHDPTGGSDRQQPAVATTLCPGGKERMMRLMRLVEAHRIDLGPMITHLFTLDEIVEAYHLFESQRHGVVKVGIRVS